MCLRDFILLYTSTRSKFKLLSFSIDQKSVDYYFLMFSEHELDLDDLHFERKPYNAFEAFCRSKAANILFARALADKLTVIYVLHYLLHGSFHT